MSTENTQDEKEASATAPDLPLHMWTPAQVKTVYNKKPPKPIKSYSLHELVTLKNYGPGILGGELYLASQKANIESKAETYGPAIMSKGSTPVAFVSEGK